MKNETQTLNTAERLLTLIQALSELGEAGVTELAEYVDYPTSTVHQYLHSLQSEDYAVKSNGNYRLSLKFLDHGIRLREGMPLYMDSKPVMERLAEETGEIAWLIVEEHDMAVTLARSVGEYGLKKYRGHVGGRTELHTHAAGKAILAFIDQSRTEQIIERRGFNRHTDQTITNKEELLDNLEDIRERGYAYNDNESIQGIRSVGAPIVVDGDVLGGIAVGGPQNRLKDEYFREDLPETVKGAANEIELRTGTQSIW